MHKISLYFHTLRHLTFRQVVHRVRFFVRREWWAVLRRTAPIVSEVRVRCPRALYAGLDGAFSMDISKEAQAAAVDRGTAVLAERFGFLNQEVEYEKGVNWHDPEVSRLWRYHLHYFDYIEHLMVLDLIRDGDQGWRTFKRLVSSWITKNECLRGDAWHPYTVSLRIVNWWHGFVHWHSSFDKDPVFLRLFLSSLYGQSRFLSENMEHDVRGNHLLKNIKALVWSGAAFLGKEPCRWYQKGINLLEQELPEQIWADGGHFERAPVYHATVLRDCLEIALWLKRNGHLVPASLDETVFRMMGFLEAILTPDGQLPLLKDTAWDAAPLPSDLLSAGAVYLNRSEFKVTENFGWYPWLLFGHGGRKEFQDLEVSKVPKTSRPLFDSGFFVLQDKKKGDYLIFDAGKPCPDYLPAHAHADMLSYELMVDGKRVVVDSGVYEYTKGKWRDFFRSTRAHNTVEIEGRNQSEVWDSFRVARRAQPGPVTYLESEDYAVVDARHAGYRRLGIDAMHRRIVCWEKGRFWFFVDEIYGEGQVSARNFVHLHPSFDFTPEDSQRCFIHGPSNSGLAIKTFGVDQWDILKGQSEQPFQGWYSEEFGKKTPNSVLCMEKEALLPFCFGYIIHREPDLEMKILKTANRGYEFRLIVPGRTSVINIQPGKVRYRS